MPYTGRSAWFGFGFECNRATVTIIVRLALLFVCLCFCSKSIGECGVGPVWVSVKCICAGMGVAESALGNMGSWTFTDPNNWWCLKLLRNRRLRSVSLPVPFTLITYWSCSLTSTTVPLRSQRVGNWPAGFWMKTLKPTVRFGRVQVCSFHFSIDLTYRVFKNCSFKRQASLQWLANWLFWNAFKSLRMVGRVSLNGWPNSISAGDSLHPGSGVLRWMSRACVVLSLSRFPCGSTLSIKSLFVDFTAVSALPFDEGR